MDIILLKKTSPLPMDIICLIHNMLRGDKNYGCNIGFCSCKCLKCNELEFMCKCDYVRHEDICEDFVSHIEICEKCGEICYCLIESCDICEIDDCNICNPKEICEACSDNDDTKRCKKCLELHIKNSNIKCEYGECDTILHKIDDKIICNFNQSDDYADSCEKCKKIVCSKCYIYCEGNEKSYCKTCYDNLESYKCSCYDDCNQLCGKKMKETEIYKICKVCGDAICFSCHYNGRTPDTFVPLGYHHFNLASYLPREMDLELPCKCLTEKALEEHDNRHYDKDGNRDYKTPSEEMQDHYENQLISDESESEEPEEPEEPEGIFDDDDDIIMQDSEFKGCVI